MKITSPIKSSALFLTLGMALCLPANIRSQEAAPKDNTAKKQETVAAPRKKEADPANVKQRPKAQARSAHKAIPAPSRKGGGSKQTWLGVAMAPVPEVLREHLALGAGFGIHIQQVVENSPAQKAGLRRNDILTQLDEQILTTPEHLSILIRSMKKGDEIALRLIRQGKPQTIKLALGENEKPNRPSFRSHHSPRSPHSQNRGRGHHSAMPHHMQSKEWKDAMKRHQEMRANTQKQKLPPGHPQLGDTDKAPFSCPIGNAQCPQKGNTDNCPKPKQQPGAKKSPCCNSKTKPNEVKKEDCKDCEKPKDGIQKSGKPPAISVRPGFPIKVFGAVGIVKIDNEEGELTLTQDGDSYAMVIKNKEGKEIFSGPYDTEKGVAALPKEAKAQLKKMKLADLDVILPKNALKIKESSEKKGSSSKKETKPGELL